MNGLSLWCCACDNASATSFLPVPLSRTMSTVDCVGATVRNESLICANRRAAADDVVGTVNCPLRS